MPKKPKEQKISLNGSSEGLGKRLFMAPSPNVSYTPPSQEIDPSEKILYKTWISGFIFLV
jgi:hypothetical protein